MKRLAVDLVILNDGDDAINDVDEYFISGRAIRKGDQGTGLETIVEMSFIDRITFVCDEDPNLIKFDGAGLQQLDIDGGSGLDTAKGCAGIGIAITVAGSASNPT